jgi:signal transduction histidine kinase
MSLQREPTKTGKRSSALATGLRGRWLVLARAGWAALVAFTLAIFFASLPMYLAQMETPCAGATCSYGSPTTPEQAGVLTEMGLSPGDYAASTLVLTLALVVVCLVISTLIVWRKSDDRMAMLVALMLVTLGPISVTSTVLALPSPWQVPNACLFFLALALFALVFSVFPSGRFVPRWTRWTLVAFLVVLIPFTFFPNAPFTLNGLSLSLFYLTSLVEFAILAVVQLYRYRRVSSPLQRQQTKWVVFGIAVPCIVIVVGYLLLFFPALDEPDSVYLLALNVVTEVLILLLPLSFGFAMLRSRLWDIDALINRTLVYGALTASLALVYVGLIIGLQVLLRGIISHDNSVAIVLSTLAIAALFLPLRQRIQRMINRMIYGERDEPYAVLSRLGSRLEATLAPEAILPTIVETVAQAFKLPYAAIALKQGDEFVTAASYGLSQDNQLILPLVYHTEIIGQLLLAPRAPGEAFTTADRRLLEDITHQAGVAVHAVSLTADLQRSREQLVTTREEERRRLRRDLHDGLGSTLAALHLQAGAIRTMMRYDLPAADAELVDLQTEIRASIADIRRLVYELRPPTLDELGLVGAIQQITAQCNMHSEADGASGHIDANLHVMVEEVDQLPALPAAVEVAAYRIAQEALTNVVRHAHACNCTVRLSLLDGFRLEVTDDGVGLSAEQHAGVGLLSMRERATEVGGSCEIEPIPGHGTRVLVKLPLPKE